MGINNRQLPELIPINIVYCWCTARLGPCLYIPCIIKCKKHTIDRDFNLEIANILLKHCVNYSSSLKTASRDSSATVIICSCIARGRLNVSLSHIIRLYCVGCFVKIIFWLFCIYWTVNSIDRDRKQGRNRWMKCNKGP